MSLGGGLVLRQEVCGLLLRDDDHGDHATEEHEHAGDGEARNQVFDEQCAEHGADRSADGGAGAVEGGHGATDLGRHAVGQDGDHRRDHAVQTEHAGAVEDGQQHGVMRGAGRNRVTPRSTAGREYHGVRRPKRERERSEKLPNIRLATRDATAVNALTMPTNASALTPEMVLLCMGSSTAENDTQTGHPQHSEYQEACAETCGVHLGRRLARCPGKLRILFRRGDVGVVSGKALRLAGDCFTHETLSFGSCFSSELMLCAIPHLSGYVVKVGGLAPSVNYHVVTNMFSV